MSWELLLCMGTLLALAGIGTPIGYAILTASIVWLAASGAGIGTAGKVLMDGLYNSFVLLAVPLFIVAAGIMNAGTISDRLLAFCTALVGRFRGGLGHVNVVASLIFSGMSGSAVADAAGIGRIVIDMMTREGRYPRGYAAAITAASATIGPIIPPSIPMVLYALVSNTSVGYLFLGGVLPGLFMGIVLMIMNAWAARKRNFALEEPVALSELPRQSLRAFPALLMPAILLWGIYGGVTTPTEAAALAALYALILASVFYNLLLLLLGCVLDATTIILVVLPLFLPACRELGIDLVHFGVLAIVNCMIGLITPPYGILLFVLNAVTRIPLGEIIREIWPFFAVLVLALLAMILIPDLVLMLPRAFGYAG